MEKRSPPRGASLAQGYVAALNDNGSLYLQYLVEKEPEIAGAARSA